MSLSQKQDMALCQNHTYPCILFFQKNKKYSRKYIQIQKKTIFLQDKTT